MHKAVLLITFIILSSYIYSQSSSFGTLSTPKEYDAKDENYSRYKNSPCFSELGFVPGRDNESLYKACEEGKNNNSIQKYGLIAIAIVCVGGLVAYYQRSETK